MQQVLYLEAEDDLPAIRELLEGAQAKRVLLVVPKGSRIFREPLNLRILRRYANDLALDVALITRDGRTKQLAKEEGIASLSSITRGKKGRWKSGSPRRSSAQRAAVAQRTLGSAHRSLEPSKSPSAVRRRSGDCST